MTVSAKPHPVIEEDIGAIVERVGPGFDRLEGRSLVITGATGMLASYLTQTVSFLNRHRFSRPCRLTGIVRRIPEEESALGYLLESPGITYLKHDARTAPQTLQEADYLVLAATKGSPTHYLEDPIGTMELNGSGLNQWLELGRELNSKAILYFSSGEIYGTPDPDAVPTPENYVGRVDTTSPRAVYAGSKRYGEILCLAYYRQHNLPVKIVRPFQIFGPGFKAGDGRAMADFLTEASQGGPIKLNSAGKAKRTFMYIADATVAFWRILLEGSPGSVYNVGASSPEVAILELAERIAAMAGGGCRVQLATEIAPTGEGSPQRTCPDISRLEADFDFKAAFGLDDLIKRTLRWLQDTTSGEKRYE